MNCEGQFITHPYFYVSYVPLRVTEVEYNEKRSIAACHHSESLIKEGRKRRLSKWLLTIDCP